MLKEFQNGLYRFHCVLYGGMNHVSLIHIIIYQKILDKEKNYYRKAICSLEGD